MTKFYLITITAVLFLYAQAQASRIEYKLVLQYPFNGSGDDYSSYIHHEAIDLNEKGNIVGRVYDEAGDFFFWSKTNGIVLLNLPCSSPEINALNNHDQMAGSFYDHPKRKAAIWDCNGLFTDIGSVFDNQNSRLKQINDHGTAVGYVENDVFIRASNGQIQYPGITVDSIYQSIHFNNAGQIAGHSTEGPFLWDPERGLQYLKIFDNTTYDDLSIMDLSETGRVTAYYSIYQNSGYYFWDDPNELPVRWANNLVDRNEYGQGINEFGAFYDGQYNYFKLDNCIDYFPNLTFPFSLLTPDVNNIDACRFDFVKVNDRGQILANGVEPYISCLWEPVRIVFDDLSLVNAIADELNLAAEPNYVDVLEMTHLNANNYGVETLSGLEYAFNLQYLDVRNNPLDKRSVCYTLETIRRRNPQAVILYDSYLYDDCTVEFGDPRVQHEVAQKLGISEPNFIDMQSKQLRSLSVFEANDLSGLEYAVYLNELFLPLGEFSDISYLSNLYWLNSLSIFENQNLSDISPLANLPCLEELICRNCSISDIRALLPLKNLRTLNLESNPIDPVMMCEVMPQVRMNNRYLYDVNIDHLSNLIDGCSSNLGSVWQLSDEWLRSDCTQDNNWCYDRDINRDGRINLDDLSYVAYFWLKDETYF